MSIDKAFETDAGFLVENGPFFTGGAAPPVGLDLPVNTIYVQSGERAIIWQKHGATTSDWRTYSAQDASFDPTGSTYYDAADITVEEALNRVQTNGFGGLAQLEYVQSMSTQSTTGMSWMTKSGFPFTTVGTKTAGVFEIGWHCELGQTKKDKQVGLRVSWKCTSDPTYTVVSELVSGISSAGEFNNRSGFAYLTLPIDDTLDILIEWSQPDTVGVASIREVVVRILRIEDL